MPNPEDYLASLLTTPEQEAKNLRASRSKQRVLAFADALRHIGNIYTTTQGAPAMQFNDPTTMERTRYQQDKLLRDANNMKYYTYQQQKRAQDLAAQKNQWEMLNGAAKLQLEQRKYELQQEQAQAKMAGDLMRAQKIQAEINRVNALLPGELKAQTALINQRNASAGASSASAELNRKKAANPELFRGNGSVNGYDVIYDYETFPDGTVRKTGAHRTPVTPPAAGDDTPPSRRGTSNENTPPSRR